VVSDVDGGKELIQGLMSDIVIFAEI